MKYQIGDVVSANGFPGVVMESNRSEGEYAPVLCALFGWDGLEMGSVYLKDISLSEYKVQYFRVEEAKREQFNQIVEKFRKDGEKKRAAAARRAERKARAKAFAAQL